MDLISNFNPNNEYRYILGTNLLYFDNEKAYINKKKLFLFFCERSYDTYAKN
jgi:hypothetical protein